MLMAPTNEMVNRDFLATIPTPESTDTFKPIPHTELVDACEEALSYRRIRIERSEFAVSKDGMKMFGMLEVNNEMDGIKFGIGLRNSNDKSMRLGMVAGYRVNVCTNLMFEGDFNPLQAKHTKGLDLIEAVSIGVDRIQRRWSPMRDAIVHKQQTPLTGNEARMLIYQAFMEEKFPITLMKNVHRDYFDQSAEKFCPGTFWAMENAFTSAIHSLKPTRQYQVTAKLGAYLNSAISPA